MDLEVPVAGLDNILGSIAPGRIVALEGGGDTAASHLAARLAAQASEQGRSVDIVATRPRLYPSPRFGRAWSDVPLAPAGDVVVDSFSLLASGVAPAQLAADLQALLLHLEQSGGNVFLVLDHGIMDPMRQKTVEHFCDGLLRFEVQTDGVDVHRMLRVPRWLDGAGRDVGIFYEFDGRRLVVDTRRRHV